MKLMRNDPKRSGLCKYALVRLDKLTEEQITVLAGSQSKKAELATIILNNLHLIEFGEPETEEEFFAIKLKDSNSPQALKAYADALQDDGEIDMAAEIDGLTERSGSCSKWCKRPD